MARNGFVSVVRIGRAGRYADRPIVPAVQRREHVAKAVRAAWPVRRPCAVLALAHREFHGVWGGRSEADRRRRLSRP